MGRTPKSKNNNNSVANISVNNHSVIEEDAETTTYDEFIKQFSNTEPVEGLQLIGCENQIAAIKRRLQLLIKGKPVFILLEGPTGTGKTTLVKQLAKEYESSIKFFYLKAPWCFTKEFGYPRKRLELLFKEASERQPSVIFIDKIDRLCPNKKQNDSKESLILDALLDQLETCKSNPTSKVMIIAATNKLENIDSQLSNYMKKEIPFCYFNQAQIVEALTIMLKEYPHNEELAKPTTLSNLACNMSCYSYYTLQELCVEANIIAEENGLDEIDVASFKKAQEIIRAPIAKSIVTPCPKLQWSDIGGNHRIKEELIESVIWPIQYPKIFQRCKLEAPRGALLYGPPGCSKTMMARALATESTFNFICIKGPELLSKWVGDTEAEVRKLYRNAKMLAPCIIFFDEFDGLASRRSGQSNNGTTERVVAQLLSEMDSVVPADGVFTLAATNMPSSIDTAFLRPGRLESVIYVPLPSREERKEIFDIHIRGKTNDDSIPVVIDTEELAERTEGYSGAEIMGLCKKAFYATMTEIINTGKDVEQIDARHFEVAFEKVKPFTSAEDIKRFENFRDRSSNTGGLNNDNNVIDDSNNKNVTNNEEVAKSISNIVEESRMSLPKLIDDQLSLHTQPNNRANTLPRGIQRQMSMRKLWGKLVKK